MTRSRFLRFLSGLPFLGFLAKADGRPPGFPASWPWPLPKYWTWHNGQIRHINPNPGHGFDKKVGYGYAMDRGNEALGEYIQSVLDDAIDCKPIRAEVKVQTYVIEGKEDIYLHVDLIFEEQL